MTREEKRALYGILLATALVAMDQTIVATALPRIVEELGGTTNYAWIATGYMLASAVMMPIGGRLADVSGPRRVLVFMVVVFLVGSILCGMAWNMTALTIFRSIQGIGGAITAIGGAAMAVLFTTRDRTIAGGYFGAAITGASVVGPVLGGILTDMFTWRAVFYVNVPLGLMALYFLRFMPVVKPAGDARFDKLGAIGLVAWAVPFLLVLSWGGSEYAWTSPAILGLSGMFVIFLAAFVYGERKTSDPLFDLGLLKNRSFLWGSIASWLAGGCFVGGLTYLPLYLLQVRGVSATYSGMIMLPMIIGMVAASIGSGRLALAIGRTRLLFVAGAATMVVGLLVMRNLIQLDTPVWQIIAMLGVMGGGYGFIMTVAPLAVQQTVDLAHQGTANSSLQLFRQFGSVMGTALMGTAMAAVLHAGLPSELNDDLQRAGVDFQLTSFQEEANLKGLFKDRVADVNKTVDAAIAGDRDAYQKLQNDPLMTTELRALIPSGGLQGASATTANDTIEQALDKKLAQLEDDIEHGVDETLSSALRTVYLYDLVLAILALAAALLAPEVRVVPTAQAGQPLPGE